MGQGPVGPEGHVGLEWQSHRAIPTARESPKFPSIDPPVHHPLSPSAPASSRDARPVPEPPPGYGCPMPGRDIALGPRQGMGSWAGDGVPGRGRCSGQGSGAGGHPRHRWGLWPWWPVPRYNVERIPLPKGGSHPPNPNSDGFLHPQNTRLISQKPQTLKEEGGGGEIKKKEKKNQKEFTMILPPLTGYRKTSVLLFLLIRVVLTCSIITLLSTYCAEAFPHSSASHSFLSGSCDAVTQRLSNQRCRNQKEKENGWRRRENKCPCFSLPLSFSSVPPPSIPLFFFPLFFFF